MPCLAIIFGQAPHAPHRVLSQFATMALALRIYREAGVKMGPLADASPSEIKALESLSEKRALTPIQSGRAA